MITALALALAMSTDLQPNDDWKWNDAHCHVVNFVQEGAPVTTLLDAMDRAKVQHAMVCGLPLTKKWTSGEDKRPIDTLQDDGELYYYSATDVIVAQQVTGLNPAQRKRVHPFLCGFNPTDRNAIDHVRRMVRAFPGLWEGIGEVMLRHDDVTALTKAETPRADHVAMAPIYEFAAEHSLPVWLHSNVTAPQSPGTRYLKELQTALRTYPRTKFVWCHAGHAPRLSSPELAATIRKVLDEHKNLWIDLSWLVIELEIWPMIDKRGQWVKLMSDHPDRFLVGSDVVGDYSSYEHSWTKFERLLKLLPPAARTKIAKTNFLGLLPKSGAIAR